MDLPPWNRGSSTMRISNELLECFLHNYLDILLKLSDGRGWVQQKTQMDCTHMFEFEATQLAIVQGKHVLSQAQGFTIS